MKGVCSLYVSSAFSHVGGEYRYGNIDATHRKNHGAITKCSAPTDSRVRTTQGIANSAGHATLSRRTRGRTPRVGKFGRFSSLRKSPVRFLYSRQLEHFLAAYETLSLRKAAERCNVTQPALTKSIQKLEEVLSLTLFERHANGVVPTPAAEIVRRHGRLIVDNCRHIEIELALLRGGHAGALHIGSGTAWSVTRMPGLIAALHLRYPKLGITVEDGLGEQLVPRLLDGKLDVVVGRMPPEALPDDYKVVKLPSTEMAVFVRKGHPLSQRVVAVHELANWEVIGFTGDELGRSQRDRYFDGIGVKPPRTIVESSSLEILLTTVAKSDSLAVLLDMFEQRVAAAGLQRLKLDQPLWRVDLGICFHRQSLELEPLRTLLDLAGSDGAREALLPTDSTCIPEGMPAEGSG